MITYTAWATGTVNGLGTRAGISIFAKDDGEFGDFPLHEWNGAGIDDTHGHLDTDRAEKQLERLGWFPVIPGDWSYAGDKQYVTAVLPYTDGRPVAGLCSPRLLS